MNKRILFYYVIISLTLVVICSFDLWAQIDVKQDSTYKFLVPKMLIFERQNNRNETTFFTDNDYYLMYAAPNALLADTNKFRYSLPYEKIRKIAIRDGNYFGRGAMYGAITGFTVGFMAGLAIYELANTLFGVLDKKSDFGIQMLFGLTYGTIISLPGALIGGLIGAIMPDYEVVKFYSPDKNKRRQEVISAFRKWGKFIP